MTKGIRSWTTEIRQVLQHSPRPVALKNGTWGVTDRKSLWRTLGSRIFDSHLDALKDCAVEVLTECDPRFDLPSEDRHAASIYGKTLRHSPSLRKGMAESLALLGTQPSALNNCSQHKAEATAAVAVREIFESADWMLWGSLDPLLPILAEASPVEFLRAIGNALQESPCLFDELFSQETPGIIGANYITGLLWALETLAWDETHLVPVCVLLGKLAVRDPGGNWLNRPAGSLTRILLPWLPQTTAPTEKRKTALATLQKETPQAAWNLLLSLLPNMTQSSTKTHRPTWRNTVPEDWEEGVSNEEYFDQIHFCAELTVKMASNDIEKLKELINQLNGLPSEALDQVLQQLESENVRMESEAQRTEIWSRLVSFVNEQVRMQTEFPDERAALGKNSIARIRSIAAKLAPQNPLRLHRWLFNHGTLHSMEAEGTWEEKQERLSELQQQAIQEVLSNGGVGAVLQFAEEVEVPAGVGYSLGSIADQTIDAQLLPSKLESNDQKLGQFTSAYVDRRQRDSGWEWADGLDWSQWSPSQTGQFLCYLPFGQDTWNRVATWLAELEGEYWSRPSTGFYFSDDDLNYAMRKYTEYGNHTAAIKCLYNLINDGKSIDKDQVIRTLSAAIKSWKYLDSGEVAHIIRALQDDPRIDQDDMLRLEWIYLPLYPYSEGLFKTIANRIASDPSLFCEAIRLVFKPEGTEQSTTDPGESDEAVATSVYRLLHEWRIPPGIQRDGTFSSDAFEKWLSQVKDMCEESGHLGVAQSQIGQVLIHSPPDPDGLWLHHAVANALNSEDAERMREGYHIGLANSRGAHWIDPTGKEDRDLAEKQRGKAEEIEKAGFHRLATTFRELADDYDREADRVIDRYGEHSEE